jgi:hypothetical protein
MSTGQGLSCVATRRSNTRILGIFYGKKDYKGVPTGSSIEIDAEVVDGVTIINKEKGVVGDTSVEFRQVAVQYLKTDNHDHHSPIN